MQNQGPVIVIDRQKGITRAAYLEDGDVKSFYVSSGAHRIGDIYKAKISSNRMSGVGWFLQLGEHDTGFLPRSERISENVSATGDFCIVQIRKEAWAGKPVQVTEQIQINGRGLIYLPSGGYAAVSHRIDEKSRETLRSLVSEWCSGDEGVIVRTAAIKMTIPELHKELGRCRSRWKAVQKRAEQTAEPAPLCRQFSLAGSILNENHFPPGCTVLSNVPTENEQLSENAHFIYRPGEDLFSSCKLSGAFKHALNMKVPIGSIGGFLIIEQGETLTAIDVNSGPAASGRDWEKTAAAINRAAAAEIARQIRLRGTGGMIVIDFIRMKRVEDREAVLDELRTAFAKDPSTIHLFGFSPMGLVELTRKRRGPGLEGLTAGDRISVPGT